MPDDTLDGLAAFLLGVADKLAAGHGTHRFCTCCPDPYWCPECQEDGGTDPGWRCSSVRQADGIRALVAGWEAWSSLPDNPYRDDLTTALYLRAAEHRDMEGYDPRWGLS